MLTDILVVVVNKVHVVLEVLKAVVVIEFVCWCAFLMVVMEMVKGLRCLCCKGRPVRRKFVTVVVVTRLYTCGEAQLSA